MLEVGPNSKSLGNHVVRSEKKEKERVQWEEFAESKQKSLNFSTTHLFVEPKTVGRTNVRMKHVLHVQQAFKAR